MMGKGRAFLRERGGDEPPTFAEFLTALGIEDA
jgi:hypothetical protein